MKECRQFMVFGHVQGVGFRKFVKAKVDAINEQEILLSGHIRNLEDGSVRAVAQGESADLDTLEKIIKAGTIRSVIERVEVTSLDIDESLHDFEILR